MAFQLVRRNDPAAVDRLLDELPGWFGMASANRDYVQAAAVLDSYLALENDQVIGAALVRRHFPAAAEIYLLVVSPRLHRQGIGRRLVEAIEDSLRSEGVLWLQVKTLGPSHPSEQYALTREFYRAVGFEPLEEILDYWPGNPMLIHIKRL